MGGCAVIALISPLALMLALLLDGWWGELRRWHPVVGFGRVANRLEKICNRGAHRIVAGSCAWCVLVLPLIAAGFLLQQFCRAHSPGLMLVAAVLVLYFALGKQSLREHAQAVLTALRADDLPYARHTVAMMVSRDVQTLDHAGVSGAAVESVLENGSDAVIASLFWFAVGGIPAVLLHRAANTLDAMWGYRNARFNEFGRVAARVDDVLNYIPARLTAMAYALTGSTAQALHSWYAQAHAWSSPNAGPVMAAGAGALQLQLGGAAIYHGAIEQRPPLGCGRPAQANDIQRALALLDRSVWLCVGVIVTVEIILWKL